MLRLIRQIEANIKTKINKISTGELNVESSGIDKQFNKLRDLDEASYEILLNKFLRVINQGEMV
jgi:hypothetical protein